MGRGVGAAAAALALAFTPCTAWAQGLSPAATPTAQDKAAATALYEDAKALLVSGRVGEACRKLEESRRLDPLPGTVLNLAACHEREGLTASAAAEFREARAMAEHDGRGDRVAFADAHIRALEPRLSTLVIVVDEDTADLQVTRDGVVLGRAAWRTRIPVDPGMHVVLATAPGRLARRVEIHVGPDGDTQTARIPPLDEAPSAPPPVVSPPAPALASPLPSTVPPSTAARGGLSTRRSWALATTGLAVVGVGAGAWLGARAIQKHGDPGYLCTTSPCSATSVSLNDEAKTAADGSTVAFAVGAAALAVSAWLWFGDSVSVSAGVGRLDVTGRF